jgi:two-component system, NtrC family, sensor kinase
MGRTVALNKMATERAVRRGLETRVLSSEARFRTLFDQASDAIVITTRGDFTIIELNDRARRLLGLNDGVGGAKVSMESFRDRTVPLRAKDTQRLDRMPSGTALNLVSNDGRVNAVIMERTPVDVDEEPGYQFVFKELTERSQLEQQVRQAEKLSALGQMISGIAHELNNPLALIKGHLDLMLNRPDLPLAFRDDLSKVALESNRAAKLVRSFLSFAREQPPQRTAVDLNLLIQSVVELRKFDSLVAQTEIELALEPSLPQITADPDQVQQIMVNLINNALHAIVSTGSGGKIRVITEATDEHVRLRFEDNGPGVPVELRSRIFEPFFTTKETGAGTGLGLSISHSIMSEHGGKISCSSARLGGAAFILEFPRPAPADIPAPVLTDSPFVADHTGRVLVLDDEQALADMVGQMLSFYGHQVVVTSTPMQALEYIAREHFDAVISDYRMPLLDGREFHGEVRKINPDIASRIIFLTGDVLSEESRTFFGSIGNPRLTKPFQLETVARTVNDILMRRAA